MNIVEKGMLFFDKFRVLRLRRRTRSLLRKLAGLNFSPKNIELSTIGCYHFGVAFDQRDNRFISNLSAGSQGKNVDLVIAKSLSEFIERKAVFKNSQKYADFPDGKSSTGYAAYPIGFGFYKSKTRETAYREALERFAFVHWWKDLSLHYEIESIEIERFCAKFGSDKLFDSISNVVVERIDIIKPSTTQSSIHTVIILIAHLKGNGFMSASACETVGKFNEGIDRCQGELFRHLHAWSRMKTENLAVEGIYETRIAHFGCGLGSKSVIDRLNKNGLKTLAIPNLVLDSKVDHDAEKYFYVHRCLFEGQPNFMDPLEITFCI